MLHFYLIALLASGPTVCPTTQQEPLAVQIGRAVQCELRDAGYLAPASARIFVDAESFSGVSGLPKGALSAEAWELAGRETRREAPIECTTAHCIRRGNALHIRLLAADVVEPGKIVRLHLRALVGARNRQGAVAACPTEVNLVVRNSGDGWQVAAVELFGVC